MASGKIKWWDNKKGFGFIAQQAGQDVFVHHTAILGSGFKVLNEGDEVSFDIVASDRGPMAHHVQRIGGRSSIAGPEAVIVPNTSTVVERFGRAEPSRGKITPAEPEVEFRQRLADSVPYIKSSSAGIHSNLNKLFDSTTRMLRKLERIIK